MTTNPTPDTGRLHDRILSLEAELAKVRDLLRTENKRANDAIGREETAEEAALEAERERDRLRAAASAVVTVAAPPTGQTAPAVWVDGHPQLEAIAAAVWEHCRTEDTSLVVDDPRNIAVAALAAVLPPNADQAAELVKQIGLRDYWHQEAMSATARIIELETKLRRLAGEAQQQPETQAGPATPSTPPCALCRHPKRDHDGRADHRAKHSPLVAGDPWCHACNSGCDYAEPPAVVSAVPPQPEETSRG